MIDDSEDLTNTIEQLIRDARAAADDRARLAAALVECDRLRAEIERLAVAGVLTTRTDEDVLEVKCWVDRKVLMSARDPDVMILHLLRRVHLDYKRYIQGARR